MGRCLGEQQHNGLNDSHATMHEFGGFLIFHAVWIACVFGRI